MLAQIKSKIRSWQWEQERKKVSALTKPHVQYPPFNESLNCLFIHIPKCGGSSIEQMICTDAIPASPPRFQYGKHSMPHQVIHSFGEERWSRFYKFTSVRNPWDTMVSSYFWWLQKSIRWRKFFDGYLHIKSLGSFNAYVKDEIGSAQINEIACNEFTDWFLDENGDDILDDIFRIEHLAEDVTPLTSRLGIQGKLLPRRNSTERGDYRSYYDDESIELIAQRFKYTIRRFDYKF